MGKLKKLVMMGGLAAVLAGTMVACGGDDDDDNEATVVPGVETPAADETVETGEPATEQPGAGQDEDPTQDEEPGQDEEPSDTEQPTETEEPTAEPASGTDEVLAAAGAALGVPFGDGCTEDEDCVRELPGGQTSVEGSITHVGYASASGGGAVVVMARDLSDAWQFWMLTQAEPYQLLEIPGELLACPDGPTLTVHEGPDASSAVTGEVAHGEVMQAQGFVLTEPGTVGAQGAGWYQVSGPVEGWAASRQTSNAAAGSCQFRDQVEGEQGTVG